MVTISYENKVLELASQVSDNKSFIAKMDGVFVIEVRLENNSLVVRHKVDLFGGSTSFDNVSKVVPYVIALIVHYGGRNAISETNLSVVEK